MDQFLSEIETFLTASGMSATAFGRVAMADPQFVHDLRKGRREARSKTISRARNFIASYSARVRVA